MQQGADPLSFQVPFRCPSHSFPKVLKNESVGMEGEGVS